MPSRIRVLPDDVVNKIAAGEVVDRPASIVKELVENALDAGADRIDISVDAGGRSSIRVVDNGCGMSRDDALLALERHATSKLRTADDLNDLHTLGFRGEALPSIAAVAQTTLETRVVEDPVGSRIRIEGGTVLDVEDAGRAPGTTVHVESLFYNTPARRKFLKSTETEWRHIVQTTTGLALAHPHVALSLAHDGRHHFRLNRTDIRGRLEALFSVEFGKDAVFIEAEEDGLRCTGYVIRPEFARKASPNGVVVNHRWVRHRGLATAVSDGYGGLLAKGVQPAFALSVGVDTDRVDVNVHPAKREVRFADEPTIYRFVAETVRDTLRRETSIPEWTDQAPPIDLVTSVLPSDASDHTHPPMVADQPDSDLYVTESLDLHNVQIGLPLTVTREEKKAHPAPPTGLAPDTSLFQLHSAYIIAHVKEGVALIDQNLAHRRILYDDAIVRFREHPSSGQALLFPVTLEFGLAEIVAVRDAIALFERVGFGIRDFGGSSVVIDAIPSGIDGWAEGALFRAMVDDLLGESASALALGDRNVEPLEHTVAQTYARHTAITHGTSLSSEEMRALIDRLFTTSEPYSSPEGRPTLYRLSLQEIEKHFL